MKKEIEILIIEDNPGDAVLIQEYLSDIKGLNCNFLVTKRLSEAKMKLKESSPDVIILDLNLPDSNGLDTLYSISDKNQKAAIIVMTGMEDEALGLKAIQSGAQNYLVKNRVSDESLQRAIHYSLVRKRDQNRLDHLFRVLSAIRAINQLITREDDAMRLVSKACKIAIDTNGYFQSWIILTDENLKYLNSSHAGLSQKADQFFQNFIRGRYAHCIKSCIESENGIIIHDSKEDCKGCPLKFNFSEKSTLVASLRHKGRYFGFMGVTIPNDYVNEKDEHDLFKEMTEDISFALFNIELQKNQQRLFNENKENEKKFKILYDQSPDMILTISTVEGKILLSNKTLLDTLGYSADELNGRLMLDLYHPDSQKEAKAILNSLKIEGRIRNRELQVVTKNGLVMYVSLNIETVKDESGKTPYSIVSWRDITQKRKNEEKLKEQNLQISNQIKEYLKLNKEYQNLNESLLSSNKYLNQINQELKIAKEKAEESEKLKSAFMANMSHEIRTPMNAIIGFSNLLKNDKYEVEKRKHFIELINNASSHLLHIIDDIIDISKIEANQLNINLSNCNLSQVIQQSYEYFIHSELLKKKPDVELKINIPSHLKNYNILTDLTRLRQVLDNLVNNAIKFTSSGIVEIGVTLKKQNQNTQIEFFVKDTGVGIPENKKDIIFERFRQIDEDSFHEGSGLGLSISKGIIELLGGQIWFESTPHKGSTFYFSIPFTPNKSSTKTITDTEHIIPDLKNKLVYIAEDDDSSSAYLKEVLIETSAELVIAKNGMDLTDLVGNKMPDLILLDINMPVKSGYECLEEIRAMDKKVKIIAQTAYAMPNERTKCLQMGCNGYISKPINMTELFDTISEVLEG